MGKSTTKKNCDRRLKKRVELYEQGLSAESMASKLKTNAHNIRIYISHVRRTRKDGLFLFPYVYPQNHLISKKMRNKFNSI